VEERDQKFQVASVINGRAEEVNAIRQDIIHLNIKNGGNLSLKEMSTLAKNVILKAYI